MITIIDITLFVIYNTFTLYTQGVDRLQAVAAQFLHFNGKQNEHCRGQTTGTVHHESFIISDDSALSRISVNIIAPVTG